MGVSNISQFSQLNRAREAFNSGKSLPLEFRRKQLKAFLELFESTENQKKICEAAYKDMRKCYYEASITEIVGVQMEIQKILRNFDEYTADEFLPFNLLTTTDSSSFRREPHGVVLIVGTWNYPFYITLLPAVAAIATGNCILMKPSEVSSHSASLMAELIPQYLDNDCYHIVLGDIERTKVLLSNKFDYIFFTGSKNVGKYILQCAASHLTPVTLELGGKSPVYIDSTASVKMTAKRIIWGKLINMGQTCIAPDYVICTKDVQRKIICFAKEILHEWYGGEDNWKEFKEFTRIVNVHHFRRLQTLLGKTNGSIEIGGRTDEEDLWIEPTFVVNVKRNDSLMEDEIFGPILPFVTVESVEEAIELMRQMALPLAMYIFSKDDEIINRILSSTRSGCVCINDTIVQAADLRLPFGGTGDSGIGQYHGKYSIDTFSHKRSVLRRNLTNASEITTNLRYPPFLSYKLQIFKFFLYHLDYFELQISSFFKYFVAIFFGFVANTVYRQFTN